MAIKTYPVGTAIIFKPGQINREVVLKDYGKVGKVVGVMEGYSGSRPLIVLKESTHVMFLRQDYL